MSSGFTCLLDPATATQNSMSLSIRASGLQRDSTSRVLPNGLVERCPIGMVAPFALREAPEGWVACDGRQYDLRAHGELLPLASKLGSAYFDRERMTLRMPDLRGRFVMGSGDGPTLQLGEMGGSETHTLSIAEMPQHKFKVLASVAHDQGRGKYGVAIGQVDGKPFGPNVEFIDRSLVSGGDEIETDSLGGGRPHSIMPPYTVMNYFIKY